MDFGGIEQGTRNDTIMISYSQKNKGSPDGYLDGFLELNTKTWTYQNKIEYNPYTYFNFSMEWAVPLTLLINNKIVVYYYDSVSGNLSIDVYSLVTNISYNGLVLNLLCYVVLLFGYVTRRKIYTVLKSEYYNLMNKGNVKKRDEERIRKTICKFKRNNFGIPNLFNANILI